MGGNTHTKPEDNEAVEIMAAGIADSKRIELVHDVPREDREREREVRDRAEDARIAKSKKKMKLISMRREAAKQIIKLKRQRSDAEIALAKAGKEQTADMAKNLPDFVTRILEGYKAGGLSKQAIIQYSGVEMIDKDIKLTTTLLIATQDDKHVGDEESGYTHTRTHRETSTDILYVDPTDKVVSAYKELQTAKHACEENNKLLTDIDELLGDIEMFGEAAEVTILEEGLSEERRKRVGSLEKMYDTMLGTDAARLLGSGTES